MPLNVKWHADLQALVLGGADRGVDVAGVRADKFSYGRNLTVRGGLPRSRPRMVRRMSLGSGLIQGGTVFSRTGKLTVSVGGVISSIDCVRWTSDELTDPQDRNNPNLLWAYFCETDGSLVIQNGSDYPLVWDGSDFVRFTTENGKTLPIGTVMCYSNGRLAVAVGSSSRSVRIGDIRQGHQTELGFTEATSLLGGGDLSFPSRVMAMAALPVVDTQTGSGPLIVGVRNRTYSLRTDIVSRNKWPDIDFQSVLFPRHGITGPNAFALINQDIYFRSLDGLRSLRLAAADYNSPGNTPISAEVAYRMKYDSPDMLDGASMVYFDNRLLITHSPKLYSQRRRALHEGLISLNFETLSSLGQKAGAAYDGEWDSDFRIVQLVEGEIEGVSRCFALAVEDDNQAAVWEILSEQADFVNPVGAYRIDFPTHELHTRLFAGSSPIDLKDLRRLDLWVSGLDGDSKVKAYFRPEKRQEWVEWDTWAISTGQIQTVNANGELAYTEPVKQGRIRLMTRTPAEELASDNKWPVSKSSGFQFKLEWLGNVTIDKVVVYTEADIGMLYADNPVGETATEIEDQLAYLAVYLADGFTRVGDDLDVLRVIAGEDEDLVLVLKNEGLAELPLGDITLTDAADGGTWAVVDGPGDTSLAPNETTTITVRYTAPTT
jgi:hypothetical protein